MLILDTIRNRCCCVGNNTNIVASYEYKVYIDEILLFVDSCIL